MMTQDKFDFKRAVMISTAQVTPNGDVTFNLLGHGRNITAKADHLKCVVSDTLARTTGHPCLDEQTLIIGFPDAITKERYLQRWGLDKTTIATA